LFASGSAFRERRAEVSAQPARVLRQIRLVKLVKLSPRMGQVAQRLLVVVLGLLPDARAIHLHDRATVVGRMIMGDRLAVHGLFGRAA
jgi:hypothetical protein